MTAVSEGFSSEIVRYQRLLQPLSIPKGLAERDQMQAKNTTISPAANTGTP